MSSEIFATVRQQAVLSVMLRWWRGWRRCGGQPVSSSLLQSPPVCHCWPWTSPGQAWLVTAVRCCCCCCCCPPSPPARSPQPEWGEPSLLTPSLLPSFPPSLLPTVIFRAFELKVGSRLARLKLAVSPVQGGQHLRTWPPLALQTLLSALRIVQQRLCKNFILTFSWVAGGPSCPEL